MDATILMTSLPPLTLICLTELIKRLPLVQHSRASNDSPLWAQRRFVFKHCWDNTQQRLDMCQIDGWRHKVLAHVVDESYHDLNFSQGPPTVQLPHMSQQKPHSQYITLLLNFNLKQGSEVEMSYRWCLTLMMSKYHVFCGLLACSSLIFQQCWDCQTYTVCGQQWQKNNNTAAGLQTYSV